MEHRISNIQIIPVRENNGLLGFASIVLDEGIYLGSIGIHTRPRGGFRLTYPTKNSREKPLSIFHPITKIVADQIEDAVIAKFEEIVGLRNKTLWIENSDKETGDTER